MINGVDGGIASESLTLKILPLMEEDMTMIKIPQATESTPGKLDLSTFTGDAEFIIPPWPLIAEKQLVWMDMDSESSTQHLLKGYSVTSDDVTTGVTGSISRTALENILVTTPEGALLEFAARVKLDDSDSPTTPINFPILELQVLYRSGGSESGSEDFEGEDIPIGEFSLTFETEDLIFKGDENPNLHHQIIASPEGRAISLQTATSPAELTFKKNLKPSYLSFDISISGISNSCGITCHSAEQPSYMTIPENSSRHAIFNRKEINRITFSKYSPPGSTAGPSITVVLDNIRWGEQRAPQ